MKTLDQKLGWIMVAFSVIFFYLISGLPPEAAMYPRFVFFIMALLSLIFLIKAYRIPSESKAIFHHVEKKQFTSVLVGSVVYVYLMQLLGYFSATFLYFVFLMWILKVQKPKLFAVSIGFCVFIFILFQRLLGVRLPTGLVM